MKQTIFILAASARVAREWAKIHIPIRSKSLRIVCLYSSEQMQGYENPVIIFADGWMRNPKVADICSIATRNNKD